MSMKMLTALQLFGIFGLYAVMTLLLPAVLFYKKISGMRFSVRFMIYQTAGNFYMITLVLVLQLLHISNWFTLAGCTALSFFGAYVCLYKRNPKEGLQKFLEDAKKLAEGKYGLRLFLRRISVRILRFVKKLLLASGRRFWKNLPDVLLMLAVFAGYMVTYGVNAFEQYGYCTSDIVVHNYWINDMGRGKPFTAGVYPLGFHCVIYYLHAVFRIDTYVLLRLFWAVQTLVIHLMLLAFIRVCCRSKYTAYAGLGIYMLVNLFHSNTYSRYISSLPQEFGMIFILPSIVFLFLFFEQKKKELCGEKGPKTQAPAAQKPAGRQESAVSEKTDFQEEERLYFLDDVLAESAAREAEAKSGKTPAGPGASGEEGEKEGISAREAAGTWKAEETAREERKRFSGIRRVLRQEFAAESSWYLLFFILDFSLTLSIHFYNTIIAGIFCIGIAAGYGFRLFRRQYFGRVMLAGITAILIAVLPLLLAYLGGTPLEGSLYWGINIINGTAKQPAAAQESERQQEEDDAGIQDGEEHFSLTDIKNIRIIKNGIILSDGEIVSRKGSFEGGTVISKGDITIGNHKITGGQMVSDAKLLDDGEVIYEGLFIAVDYGLPEEGIGDGAAAQNTSVRQPSVIDRIKEKIVQAVSAVYRTVDVYLIYTQYAWVSRMIPVCIVLLFGLSALFFALRQADYAARMLSLAVYMGLMTIIFAASELGLPELMDASGRTCIYYAYSLIALWCLCLDGVLQLVFGKPWKGRAADLLSFLLVPALAAAVVFNGMVKIMYYTPGLECNDAVTCLTNIIRENKDGTWTIVSANDELRMGEDHGYHYEMDTFLRKMEHRGGTGEIKIPTKKVYFFIEKVPIDYTEQYEGSGQKISKKGAAQRLPENAGIEMYKGESRWIEMSRMFFWAQQFQSLYPNEMEAYYETDDFVCYCVDQNEYSLFNFSIDYQYNMMRYAKE